MTQTDQRHFAFIRAINVGGRRLTNEELIEPFVKVGLNDVAAYQAAGNITFRGTDFDPERIARLHDAMTEAYGFETSVFLRSHADLRAMEQAQPFTGNELAATEGKIQVSLMSAAPSQVAIAEVLDLVPKGERLVFSGREWFWLPARGISDSQLPISAIEKLVGPMTIRTLGTVSRMLDKFS